MSLITHGKVAIEHDDEGGGRWVAGNSDETCDESVAAHAGIVRGGVASDDDCPKIDHTTSKGPLDSTQRHYSILFLDHHVS